jgi:hypothetical protein
VEVVDAAGAIVSLAVAAETMRSKVLKKSPVVEMQSYWVGTAVSLKHVELLMRQAAVAKPSTEKAMTHWRTMR